MKEIKIANKLIGKNHPVFIIAEIGTNHGGDFETAKKMILEAKEADAVKFQLFSADKLVSIRTESFNDGSGKSQLEQYEKLQLSTEEYKQLFDLANSLKLIFFASAWDEENVDFLEELGVPAYKIGSGDLTNIPLIKYIARTQKPIIISTGVSNLIEISETIEAIKKEGNNQIILLQCVANYPAKIEDSNLKTIPIMETLFNVPIGISDHTVSNNVSLAAVALGATVIEKHYTLDNTQESKFGENHNMSITLNDLKELVKGCREIKSALGNGIKEPTKSELEVQNLIRRSIIAIKDIPKDSPITKNNVRILRPASGLAPKYIDYILGRTARRDIKEGEPILWNLI